MTPRPVAPLTLQCVLPSSGLEAPVITTLKTSRLRFTWELYNKSMIYNTPQSKNINNGQFTFKEHLMPFQGSLAVPSCDPLFYMQ